MKAKTILFIAALPAELQSIKKEVKKLRYPHIRSKFFLTGVGNYKALYNLKHYIDSQNEALDFIVNIGLCGKVSSASDTIFQVYRIYGAANGHELLCPVYIDYLKKQSLLSSEKIVSSPTEMQGEQYVDMESYAIDTVATVEKIPYIIIKKPFDIVSVESKKIDANKFVDCLSDIDYPSLLEKIIDFFKKHEDPLAEKQADFLEKTLKVYQLTFSEKEIWKKCYARHISFGGDYEKFLQENKKLSKKEFLKKLRA